MVMNVNGYCNRLHYFTPLRGRQAMLSLKNLLPKGVPIIAHLGIAVLLPAYCFDCLLPSLQTTDR